MRARTKFAHITCCTRPKSCAREKSAHASNVLRAETLYVRTSCTRDESWTKGHLYKANSSRSKTLHARQKNAPMKFAHAENAQAKTPRSRLKLRARQRFARGKCCAHKSCAAVNARGKVRALESFARANVVHAETFARAEKLHAQKKRCAQIQFRTRKRYVREQVMHAEKLRAAKR